MRPARSRMTWSPLLSLYARAVFEHTHLEPLLDQADASLRSPTRCSTCGTHAGRMTRTSQSWLIVAKNFEMSASRIQRTFRVLIPTAGASSASCAPPAKHDVLATCHVEDMPFGMGAGTRS